MVRIKVPLNDWQGMSEEQRMSRGICCSTIRCSAVAYPLLAGQAVTLLNFPT